MEKGGQRGQPRELVTCVHMEGRLSISRDMRDYPLEDLWCIRRRGANFGVEVLELDLLAPKIITKAAELAPCVLIALFIGETVVLDALPHLGGVLIQQAPHCDDGL